MQHQIILRLTIWSVQTAPCPPKLNTFTPYSHFSLTLLGENFLMKPGTNKQDFSLSILFASITLVFALGSPSFCICPVPWAFRRFDGQSTGWAFIPPHNGQSVSMLFVLPAFLTILSLSLPVSPSFRLPAALLSVTHSLMAKDGVNSWTKQKDKK